MFYHQVIITNSIPFELTAEVPNKKTIAAFKEVEKMKKHPEKYKSYTSVEELFEDLKK